MYCHWEHSSRLNVKYDVDLNGGRLNYPVSLIWSTVAVSQCRTGHDCAHNSTEKLIKEHCLPLEISLNRLWPWWLLSATDKIACGMINLLKKSNKLTWLTMNSYCWARTNRPYRLPNRLQSRKRTRLSCEYSPLSFLPAASDSPCESPPGFRSATLRDGCFRRLCHYRSTPGNSDSTVRRGGGGGGGGGLKCQWPK